MSSIEEILENMDDLLDKQVLVEDYGKKGE